MTRSSGISRDSLYTHSTVPVTMTSIIVKRVSNKENKVFINSIVNKWYYIFNIVRVLKTTRHKLTCKLIYTQDFLMEEKKIIDRQAAGKLLETLGKDIIEKGKVEISGIQVALPEIIEVELEYKEKHGRKKLEIEFKWDHESTRTTSGV